MRELKRGKGVPRAYLSYMKKRSGALLSTGKRTVRMKPVGSQRRVKGESAWLVK